jgi:hypothetical protein
MVELIDKVRADAIDSLAVTIGGDRRFIEVLVDALMLHARKQQDYGVTHDPFANIRATETYGIPAWVGAEIRGHDKTFRLAKAVRQTIKGEAISLANEGVEDSLLDRLVYTAIELVLYREALATARVESLTAWNGQDTVEPVYPTPRHPAMHAEYGDLETTR